MTNIIKAAALAVPMLLAACHSTKTVVPEGKPTAASSFDQTAFIQKVSANAQDAQFVSSKMKFTVEYGSQQITLSGNMKMKRNDVIRLQLMALGFVEAARLEFTQDYVLIMDRINKQYLKAPYSDVDFLRKNGISFHTLQSLFWNELFMPGQQTVEPAVFSKYSTVKGKEDVEINYEPENSKMAYSWLASEATGRIKKANIAYRDSQKGNTQLNWDYQQFANFGKKMFPNTINITLSTPEKEVKLGMKLTSLDSDSDWETRTKVSDRYREVNIDELLQRIMSL